MDLTNLKVDVEADQVADNLVSIQIYREDSPYTVANVFGEDLDEAKSRAELFAKAPEMYRLLAKVHKFIETMAKIECGPVVIGDEYYSYKRMISEIEDVFTVQIADDDLEED